MLSFHGWYYGMLYAYYDRSPQATEISCTVLGIFLSYQKALPSIYKSGYTGRYELNSVTNLPRTYKEQGCED